MSYPAYTRAERIADGAVHILGVTAAMVGIVLIFRNMAPQMSGPVFFATCVYAAALMTMLTASAVYHITGETWARPILRRIDHAAIYFKIAATFTPLAVILNTTFGYVVLASIWSLALLGAFSKLMAARGKMSTGSMPYLLLGWIGIVLCVPLSSVLPAYSLAFAVTGGLIYTAGVIFYRWENLRYSMAIWHSFVLVASGFVLVAVTSAVAAAN